MKWAAITIGVIATLIGVIIYKIYIPFSPLLSEDSLVLPSLDNFFELLADVGECLGLGSKIAITRFIISATDSPEFTEEQCSIEDTEISGVPVRIYRPKNVDKGMDALPGMIFFHGGGLIVYTAKSSIFNKICSTISKATQSLVISVDYRLAPEHRFPAQFQDCYSVVSAVVKESSKLGIIGNKIAIMGESAGGLLAAAVSLELAKEKRGAHVAAQVLIYPWLQSIDTTCLPSYLNYSHGFALTADQVAYFSALAITGKPDIKQEYASGNISRYFMNTPFWRLLHIPETSDCNAALKTKTSSTGSKDLPHQFIQAVTDQRFSPLLADKVDGLLPTFVVSAEYDVFASEGSLFIRRLKENGISVMHKTYKSYHGFINNLVFPSTTTPMVTEAMKDITKYLNHVYYGS